MGVGAASGPRRQPQWRSRSRRRGDDRFAPPRAPMHVATEVPFSESRRLRLARWPTFVPARIAPPLRGTWTRRAPPAKDRPSELPRGAAERPVLGVVATLLEVGEMEALSRSPCSRSRGDWLCECVRRRRRRHIRVVQVFRSVLCLARRSTSSATEEPGSFSISNRRPVRTVDTGPVVEFPHWPGHVLCRLSVESSRKAPAGVTLHDTIRAPPAGRLTGVATGPVRVVATLSAVSPTTPPLPPRTPNASQPSVATEVGVVATGFAHPEPLPAERRAADRPSHRGRHVARRSRLGVVATPPSTA